jgi:predicted ester cyclase
MQEQDNIRGVLQQALQALNSEGDKTAYFDLHDDSLITHGIPENFSADKEGVKKYYREVWQAFPNAKYEFDHVVVDGNEAACMFSITGIQKGTLMGIPPSDKQVRISGMIFFRFKGSKIAERWEIIDLLSAAKQLGVRQQLAAVKSALLEYGEVKANAQLKDKINGLFKKHLV